eukprot:14264007-Alexandrium_andersonii.AAC.1
MASSRVAPWRSGPPRTSPGGGRGGPTRGPMWCPTRPSQGVATRRPGCGPPWLGSGGRSPPPPPPTCRA